MLKLDPSSTPKGMRHYLNTLLTSKADITKKILFDQHLHGEGFINAYTKLLTEGYLIIRGKVLLKRTLDHCSKCRRHRLIPSQSSLGRDETQAHTAAPPMQISYLDLAGPFTMAITKGVEITVKVWILWASCS